MNTKRWRVVRTDFLLCANFLNIHFIKLLCHRKEQQLQMQSLQIVFLFLRNQFTHKIMQTCSLSYIFQEEMQFYVFFLPLYAQLSASHFAFTSFLKCIHPKSFSFTFIILCTLNSNNRSVCFYTNLTIQPTTIQLFFDL